MTVTKHYTLAFLKRNDDILLGLKTRGLGKDFWNGFGGKVEKKETILEAARREVKEECGLEVNNLKQLGIVRHEEEGNPEVAVIHVFTATEFSGSLKPCEEMNPLQWYKYTDIPFGKTWPDLKQWCPYVVAEKYFFVLVRYNKLGEFVSNEIQEFTSIEEVKNCLN